MNKHSLSIGYFFNLLNIFQESKLIILYLYARITILGITY
jgi:hypothetical protein